MLFLKLRLIGLRRMPSLCRQIPAVFHITLIPQRNVIQHPLVPAAFFGAHCRGMVRAYVRKGIMNAVTGIFKSVRAFRTCPRLKYPHEHEPAGIRKALNSFFQDGNTGRRCRTQQTAAHQIPQLSQLTVERIKVSIPYKLSIFHLPPLLQLKNPP